MDAPRWPLSRDRQELVVMLGEMIRRFGTERFLEAPLVRADVKDFPDPWEPTLHAVHQTLYRLCWLAHIDPEIVIDDRRPPNRPDKMLLRSEIEIDSCAAGVAKFHLAQIGNDDVAGLLSHKVGQAFLELAPGEPFRTAKHESDEVEGTVAAFFLGLGVLAANSSMYRRHRAVVRGRSEYSEQEITQDGGLDVADATMLLAIQDLLRDEVQGALETLHKPQREWLEQWQDVLDPHEDELREMLGLDDERDPQPVSRASEPRKAPVADEDAHKRFNDGAEVMRVRHRSFLGLLPALILVMTVTAIVLRGLFDIPPSNQLVALSGGVAVLLGVPLGWVFWCQPFFKCSAPACQRLIPPTATSCPSCGGKVSKTITPAELQAHYRKLRAEEHARDELIDPSEFAGDPDPAVASARVRRRDNRNIIPPRGSPLG